MDKNTNENLSTQQRIMDAAAKLFLEKGYTETTTLAIAKEAGVNEATVFRHFGSKKNLYVEIFCANTPGEESILLNGLTNGENLKQDFFLIFREYVITCIQHNSNYKLSVQQVEDLDGEMIYMNSVQRFESMKTYMLSYLSLLKNLGRIEQVDSDALVEYLFSLFLIKAPEFVQRGETGVTINEQMRDKFVQDCAEFAYELLAVNESA